MLKGKDGIMKITDIEVLGSKLYKKKIIINYFKLFVIVIYVNEYTIYSECFPVVFVPNRNINYNKKGRGQ